MILLQRKFIHQLRDVNRLDQLFGPVQNAIELEHSTIPPYLTALFSIAPHSNNEIRKIIHSVVIEEMLHMTIACNLLNAIGGHPLINSPAFIPEYPGTLPMGIGNGLEVGLSGYSTDVVRDVFMKIEEPEHPLVLKQSTENLAEPDFATIGEFYAALSRAITIAAPDTLPGNPELQVTSTFFPADQLFPILTKDDALRAIDIIVQQGEGTQTSPVDWEGEVAHYYRFEQLVRGRFLKADTSAPHGYSFTGEPIPYDKEKVFAIYPNTKQSMLTKGTEAWRLLNNFNQSYRNLLNGLHTTFNGAPDFLSDTLGLMYDLKLYGEKLCAMDFPGKPGYKIGPSFEWVSLFITDEITA